MRVFNDTTYPCFKEKNIEQDIGWAVTKDLDDYFPETIEWCRKNINLYKRFLTYSSKLWF